MAKSFFRPCHNWNRDSFLDKRLFDADSMDIIIIGITNGLRRVGAGLISPRRGRMSEKKKKKEKKDKKDKKKKDAKQQCCGESSCKIKSDKKDKKDKKEKKEKKKKK